MASKGTLAIGIIVVIILICGGYFLFIGESVNVYIDGENVTSQTIVSPFAGVDTNKLNKEICEYTFQSMNNTTGNSKDLLDLCIDVIYHKKMKSYGLRNLIAAYQQYLQTQAQTIASSSDSV